MIGAAALRTLCRIPHNGSAMVIRHFLVLISAGSLVAGCASAPPPVGERIAWDGSLKRPNSPIRKERRLADAPAPLPDPNAEREKVLATLRLYSAEWVALHNQIEAEEDRRLKIKLVICRGCFPKLDEDSGPKARPPGAAPLLPRSRPRSSANRPIV
jgi:hypothetical protein